MVKVIEAVKGQWISKSPTVYKEDGSDYYDDNHNTLLRKIFILNKKVEKYHLYVGCLGYYIAYINGKRVGDYELNSDWTQYDKTIYYDQYDISDLLVHGENVIAFELGNGMYNPSPLRLFGKYNLRERLSCIGEPCVIATLYEGNKVILDTDNSWKVGKGPLLFNNLYLGERFDGSLVQEKWTKNNFDDDKWTCATIDHSKKGTLIQSYIPKCKKIRSLKPINIKENKSGNLLVDFNETLAGMINISFNGKEGQNVKLIYGEEINEDNTINPYSCVAGNAGIVLEKEKIRFDGGPGAPELALQSDKIISVEGYNQFENKFTYHSFRYVEIIGLKKSDLINIEASYVYADVEIIGNIKTTNKWFNELHEIGQRTKLNNIHSVLEDCARERLGYGGDIVALATSNLYMFDLSKLYKKIVVDFRQDQTENGGIPETAPYVGIQTNGTGQGEGPILWQFVYPYIVQKCYQYYGDEDLVRTEYKYLKKQMQYLREIGMENLEDKCLGDHGNPDTSKDFRVGTPDKKFLAHCTYLLFLKYNIIFAKLMEDPIAEEYEKELIIIKEIINKKFKNEDGTYGDKSQVSYAFAIFTDITDNPEELCESFVEKIKKDGYHLRSGIYGLMMSYEVLNKYGYDEIIEKTLLNDDFPSIGYMIKQGNTTLSEQFNMENCSLNHAMLSSYQQWFFQGLAGIRIHDDAIKANKITLRPHFSKIVEGFSCSFKTYSGVIECKWEIKDKDATWNYSIPKQIKNYEILIPQGYKVIESIEKERIDKIDFYMELREI